MGATWPTCSSNAGRFGPLARAFADATPADREGQGRDRRGLEPHEPRRRAAARRLLARPRAGERGLMEHVADLSLAAGQPRAGRRAFGQEHARREAGDGHAVWRLAAARGLYRHRRSGRRRDGDPHHGPSRPPRRQLDHDRGAAEARRGARDGRHHGRPVLVDCLTLWLSNLMHAGEDVDEATDDVLRSLDDHSVARRVRQQRSSASASCPRRPWAGASATPWAA